MNCHLTEAGEMTRRFELAELRSHRPSPSRPTPRRRDQLATSLRRVAARLEQ